ncbi:MAG: DNA-formamidopyrimidine glycosylase [Parachlamydiales bacterium]|jgi:formamidopyrimidine-DNA glycosylase
MPELPEVETIARELNASSLIGSPIISARILWARTLQGIDEKNFNTLIQKQTLRSSGRRGKYIVLTLDQHILLVHLRMTGKFAIIPSNEPFHPHERIRLYFADGQALQYKDPRKFGRWTLSTDYHQTLQHLGIEPLSPEFTVEVFSKLLQSRSKIKPFLLNQAHISGLGNIYVDEALWEAKIHPETPAFTLSKNSIRLLHCAIKNVLTKGIENQGTRLGNGQANYYSVNRKAAHQHQLQVFRRTGLPCPRCSTPIIKFVVAQRGTHICPHCQKVILALKTE